MELCVCLCFFPSSSPVRGEAGTVNVRRAGGDTHAAERGFARAAWEVREQLLKEGDGPLETSASR